LLVVLATPP